MVLAFFSEVASIQISPLSYLGGKGNKNFYTSCCNMLIYRCVLSKSIPVSERQSVVCPFLITCCSASSIPSLIKGDSLYRKNLHINTVLHSIHRNLPYPTIP